MRSATNMPHTLEGYKTTQIQQSHFPICCGDTRGIIVAFIGLCETHERAYSISVRILRDREGLTVD